MPRIITSNATTATVGGLKKVAKANKRSVGQEALIAIETHIESEQSKSDKKGRKP